MLRPSRDRFQERNGGLPSRKDRGGSSDDGFNVRRDALDPTDDGFNARRDSSASGALSPFSSALIPIPARLEESETAFTRSSESFGSPFDGEGLGIEPLRLLKG
jgi:hypothetical protein